MRLLLTNDDSHQSPLLVFAIEALEPYGLLDIVVPQREQSWRGKSMTRFTPVHEGSIEIAGRPATTLDGTPADCVNISVHHYGRPDLVVSGINAGINSGSAFLLASGTVGACLEANIAGIPGLAWSQEFNRECWQSYSATYTLSPQQAAHFGAQLARVSSVLLPLALERLKGPITWSVNVPFQLAEHPLLEGASLGANSYRSCFRRETGGFQHDLHEVEKAKEPSSDDAVLLRGNVAVTEIALSPLSARPAFDKPIPLP